jgi:hypothetical protein
MLEDLDKANVLQPNNAINLRRCGDVKRLLEDLDKANVLERYNVFTSGICGNVKMFLANYQGTL